MNSNLLKTTYLNSKITDISNDNIPFLKLEPDFELLHSKFLLHIRICHLVAPCYKCELLKVSISNHGSTPKKNKSRGGLCCQMSDFKNQGRNNHALRFVQIDDFVSRTC